MVKSPAQVKQVKNKLAQLLKFLAHLLKKMNWAMVPKMKGAQRVLREKCGKQTSSIPKVTPELISF